MDANWRPAQQHGGQASSTGPGVPVDGGGGGPGDWRTQIMETLKRQQQQQQMMNQQILAVQQQQQQLSSQLNVPGIYRTITSMNSTAQTRQVGGVDLQEELYQKVKSMKEQYLAELSEFHQKISLKLHQHEALMGPGKQSEQYEKLKIFRMMLERMISLLQISKNQIPVHFKDKLPVYEKQIMNTVASHRAIMLAPQVLGQQQFQQPSAGNAQPVSQQQQASQLPVHQVQQLHSNEPNELKARQGLAVNHDVSRRSPEASGEPTFVCPICWGTLTSPSSTICGHMFCEGCIKSATQRRKECPTCRRKLSGRNMFHRVFLPSTSLS